MNAVELLKAHLRTIQRELSQDAGQPGVDFIEIGNLCEELRLYLQVEEECLYPAMREYADIRNELEMCMQEHHQIHRILDQIERNNRRIMKDDLRRLRDLLSGHLAERENRLLRVLEQRLTPEQSDALAEKIERFKLQRAPRMQGTMGL